MFARRLHASIHLFGSDDAADFMSGLSHQTLCVSCHSFWWWALQGLEVGEWKGERGSNRVKGNLLLSWTTLSNDLHLSHTDPHNISLLSCLDFKFGLQSNGSWGCVIKVRGAFAKPTRPFILLPVYLTLHLNPSPWAIFLMIIMFNYTVGKHCLNC